ncbi:hypothetical protein D3C80_591950 [compost metagenome]
MGLERGVELVLDHPGLDPHPTLLDVDLEDVVHVPRQVDDDAVGQRLAVGTGAATTGGELDLAKARFGHQRGNPGDVLGIQREHRRLWQALVDRVIGGEHRAGGIVGANLATETVGTQGGEEIGIVGSRGAGRQLGDHQRMASLIWLITGYRNTCWLSIIRSASRH